MVTKTRGKYYHRNFTASDDPRASLSAIVALPAHSITAARPPSRNPGPLVAANACERRLPPLSPLLPNQQRRRSPPSLPPSILVFHCSLNLGKKDRRRAPLLCICSDRNRATHRAANQGQLFEALNISALWDLPVILVCENNHCKAANQGQLFEALNISALWDLPVILVCENNHFITKKDAVHCTFLARGGSLVESFAELMGRRAGCSKGNGGSMHFYKKDSGFFGGHGIVGAQVPLGCGLAFAQKYSKEGTVSFALYGDRAANQGQLFEALNISALWDLPVILVCENNHYGMGTAEWRAAKSPAYFKRGDYVPGLKVDGMDVLAVKEACKFAKEYALQNGPIILEMDTYRYQGHSMSDPGSTYRTRDEITGERDPIERVRKLILSNELATASELKDIEKEVRKEVDDAIALAKESPMPDPSELFTNVYVKGFGAEVFGADRKEVKAVLP
ncbi:hypothetical protein C4D60_Mb04t27260 [Musa balbisiana]|uniref:pyruvate dehydrogenase (acetyl-transferring) n=1 Tax=Musa balbisiana TaxID=52838 RepID=A0A4S8KEZ8_MUSBA|nr:hypothetical protein C4D60_Mb04t27260 [Musa balbisiana]